jgi:hypothetical protein
MIVCSLSLLVWHDDDEDGLTASPANALRHAERYKAGTDGEVLRSAAILKPERSGRDQQWEPLNLIGQECPRWPR